MRRKILVIFLSICMIVQGINVDAKETNGIPERTSVSEEREAMPTQQPEEKSPSQDEAEMPNEENIPSQDGTKPPNEGNVLSQEEAEPPNEGDVPSQEEKEKSDESRPVQDETEVPFEDTAQDESEEPSEETAPGETQISGEKDLSQDEGNNPNQGEAESPDQERSLPISVEDPPKPYIQEQQPYIQKEQPQGYVQEESGTTQESAGLRQGNVISGFTADSPQQLADAFGTDNAEIDGSRVTLKNDIMLNGYAKYQPKTGASLILDFAGHTITSDSNSAGIWISDGGEDENIVTLRSGSVRMTEINGRGVCLGEADTELILEDMTVDSPNLGVVVTAGQITIKSGTYRGGQEGFYAQNALKVTIDGGNFESQNGYGFVSGWTCPDIQVNGGIYSGGLSAYYGYVQTLAEVLGDGKTAYHYDGGSQGEQFSPTELSVLEVSDSFIVNNGARNGIIDIAGSVDITGFEPDNSLISVISKDNPAVGSYSPIAADGTYLLKNVAEGDYYINLVILQDGELKKVKMNGFSVENEAVVPEGAEHIKPGKANLHGILERDNSETSISIHLERQDNGQIWYENQPESGETYDVSFMDSGFYMYLITTGGGEQVSGTIYLKNGNNTLHHFIEAANSGKKIIFGSVINGEGNEVTADTIEIKNPDTGFIKTFSNQSEFTLVDLPDGTYSIMAAAGSLGGNSTFSVSRGKVVSGSTTVVADTLQSGSVSKESGSGEAQPINGAELTFTDSKTGSVYKATTGVTGNYTLPTMIYGTYIVTIKADGVQTGLGSLTIDGSPQNGGIEFLLGRAKLTGQAVDNLGRKLSGVKITAVKSMSTNRYVPLGLVTGQDGRYVIEGIPSGSYSVTAENRDGEEHTKTVTITRTGTGIADFLFGWQIGTSISGTVTGSSGGGLGGVTIKWVDKNGNTYVGITGGDGRYKIENLPDGRYDIWVEGPGIYVGLGGANVSGGSSDRSPDFHFGNGGLKGTIKDKDNRPVSGAQIELKDKNGGGSYFVSGITGPDGSYNMSGVPDGDYEVIVRAPGKQETKNDLTIAGGSQQEKDFELSLAPSALTLGGKVTGQGGVALKGITVEWIDSKGHIYRAVTGADGTYAMGNVPDGAYEVKVEGPGIHLGMGKVEVSKGAASGNKDFELGTGGLKGHIKDENGAPVPDGKVMLTNKDTGQTYATPNGSETDGSYLASGIPDGKYTVTVKVPGKNDTTLEVVISGGTIKDKEIIISPAGGNGSGGGDNGNGENGGNGNQNGGTGGDNGSGAGGNGTDGAGGSGTDGAGGSGTDGAGADNSGTGGGNLSNNTITKAGDKDLNVGIGSSDPGTLKGTVGGDGMSGAKVTVTNRETGAVYSTEPEADGSFYMENLPDGQYTIKIVGKNGDVLKADFEIIQGKHNLTPSKFTLYKNSKTEPKTGDSLPSASAAAMLGAMAYLLDLFCEKRGIALGITEEKKNKLLKKMTAAAGNKNILIRFLAAGGILALLIFYYSIGKVEKEETGKMLHA